MPKIKFKGFWIVVIIVLSIARYSGLDWFDWFTFDHALLLIVGSWVFNLRTAEWWTS
jgi:hypothetical protein